ncbi:MAG TPA: ABC transporter permease [Vicinamibacterales bacterium]|nr:ABC transporter permease [Vicinamibacterales bacterium]
MIDTLRQDVRYAVRTCLRAPGFSLLAVLTIAIGVGANAAIFSVVNATLLRPLPFPRDGELVLVSTSNRQTRQPTHNAMPALFLDWRARNHSFTGLAGFRDVNVTLSSGDRPERLTGAMVNANFFDVLQVQPALGRGFRPADEVHGAERVAVISDALWRARFGARRDVIGDTARFDDERYTIVGVAPPHVDYPDKAQLWIPPHWAVPDDPLLPPGQDPSSDRGHGYFFVLGRLEPAVSIAAASADMDAVAASLERDYPTTDQNVGAAVLPLRDDLIGGDLRSTTLLLFGAVGVLLLIAAANVSGLLMARATSRHQEMAIRIAVGATRPRILRQLLTESVLLAIVGGGAGVLLAMWLVPALVRLSPTDLTVAGDVTVDGTVLVFGVAVSALTGILFGFAPARQLTGLNVNEDLKQSARGAAGLRQRRVRGSLVAAQIALSLVLLVAAGLTVRSFIRLQRVHPGFSSDGVLTVSLSPTATRYALPPQRAELYERTLRALRDIPGVEAAGATSRLPLLPGNSRRGLAIRTLPANAQPVVDYRTATPDYFSVMRIPVLRGRAFGDEDREGTPLVAVVSQSAAQLYWPGAEPIGQHFQINVPGPEITIVGVVGDVRSASLEAAAQPTVYVPYRQDAFPFMTYALKTADASLALTNAIRAAVWSIDRDQPVGTIMTMDERLSNSLARRRYSVTLLSAFGATALLLAAVGLYGVLAFVVSQRRREIGVRIALGATAGDVVADILRQGLRLTALGLSLGLALSLAATRLMSTLLFGIGATDALTFAGAAALLAAIAAAASLVPALRASRVDPLVALRDE